MTTPTLAIIQTYDNARVRLAEHMEKAESSRKLETVLYHENGRDAFAHIVREIGRVYGLGEGIF